MKMKTKMKKRNHDLFYENITYNNIYIIIDQNFKHISIQIKIQLDLKVLLYLLLKDHH